MEKQKICPWWLGYTLLLPMRKYRHNPEKLIAPHVKPGMKIIDFGCAMGYFSIPMAKMAGPDGTVYCIDIQEKMLDKLSKRANKYQVQKNIVPLIVGKNYDVANLHGEIDFALLFAVVHEVPDKETLFSDLYAMLKPGAKILFAEPKGHVSDNDFKHSISIAKKYGFTVLNQKPMTKGLSVFLAKPVNSIKNTSFCLSALLMGFLF